MAAVRLLGAGFRVALGSLEFGEGQGLWPFWPRVPFCREANTPVDQSGTHGVGPGVLGIALRAILADVQTPDTLDLSPQCSSRGGTGSVS